MCVFVFDLVFVDYRTGERGSGLSAKVLGLWFEPERVPGEVLLHVSGTILQDSVPLLRPAA